MEAKDLLPYLKLHNDELRNSILNGKYKPMPERRVEIPKDNGKTSKLGIPTLVDRGYPFVSYAGDSLIFCKSRRGAERVSEGLTKFIENKLHLKVNLDKTEVGYVRGMKYLGHAFYKIYKTGED